MAGLCCELGARLGVQNPNQLQTGVSEVSMGTQKVLTSKSCEAFCWDPRLSGSIDLAHPYLSHLGALHGAVILSCFVLIQQVLLPP